MQTVADSICRNSWSRRKLNRSDWKSSITADGMRGHGRFYAVLRSDEVERTKFGKISGVPAHLYRRAFKDALGWTLGNIRNRPDLAFGHEVQLHYFGGFFRPRWQDFFSGRRSSEQPLTVKPRPRD